MSCKHGALALLLAVAAPAVADLKPDIIDCDPKKAARNAAMKASVGVKGPCDAERLADDAKDEVGDRAEKARDRADDRAGEAREHREDRRDQRERTLREH